MINGGKDFDRVLPRVGPHQAGRTYRSFPIGAIEVSIPALQVESTPSEHPERRVIGLTSKATTPKCS
jgi:hypothetical protein